MKMPKLRLSLSTMLALCFMGLSLAAHANQVLVPRGSGWKYHNLNQNLGTTWRETSFDDSAWAGPLPAPLGDNLENAIQLCTSVIDIGPISARYPGVYYRAKFVIGSPAGYSGLILRLQRDDYAIVYLNGNILHNDGIPDTNNVFAFSGGTATAGADETRYYEYSVSPSLLVNGTNVLAVFNAQQVTGSSDLQFDLELEGEIDDAPPTLASVTPAQGANVGSLTFINTVFSEGVANVNASDLLINNVAATSMTSNNLNDYTFHFTQPPTGTVQIAFAAGHGITDLSAAANQFVGANWTYNLNTNFGGPPNIIISEFLASNDNGAKDDDGQRNDWLELYNVGPLDANLDGWFLTDTSTNLTKWRIPALALNNNGYVLIWCSAKNRTNLNAPLHTSFKLQKDAGGFLALVNPQTNIVSAFTNYPVQSADVSYGRDRIDPNLVGYFSTPTPEAQNISGGSGFMGPPIASHANGVYTNDSIALVLSNTNGSGTMRYTTDGALPTSGSLLYSGPIPLSANSTIKARVFPPAGTNLLPSTVIARNFVFLDSTSTNFTSRMPTLIISTEGRAIPADVPPGGARAKGSVVVIDTVNGHSSVQGNSDVHELAEFEIFGQTSASFAKRPIRMEIQDSIGNDLDKEVLGMPADSDWRLRNPYNDKTLMNDFLGFTLWERMGHYSVRRKLVEVFIDQGGGRLAYPGDYYGVMVLVETIKVNKDRVDIPRISPYSTNLTATNGGFIFKRDKVSTGDLDFTSPGGGGFAGIPLKLHEPKPKDLRYPWFITTNSSFPGAGFTPSGTNQLTYLRNFLGTMERALYTNTWTTQTGANHYTNYLDPIAFADQFLHVEFTKQIDGYRLSDYFNKGRDGRIGPGPVWDWNLAFGNADYAEGGQTNTWYYERTGETDHPWARRLVTGTTGSGGNSGDPEFLQLIADRWAIFRTNVLNGTNLNAEIDQLAASLNEAAARDLYGKYRANLIGRYTWPNPDGGVATNGSIGSLEGRDVDFVRPTNYMGMIETVAPSTITGSIIGQMKKWVLGRYLWIDGQFTQPPTFSVAGGMVTNGSTVTITPPAGAVLYYTTDGTDPRLSGGATNPAAISSNGPVTLTVNANTRIFARAKKVGAFKNTWGGPAAETYFTVTPGLRITEIMYHPAPPPIGSTNSTSDFEYIEVKNIGATPLNVNGYSITGGVQFQFPNVTLTNGQSAVIVANTNAFQSRYGTSLLILGTFTGSLANEGENLVLSGTLQETILDFSYSDGWYPATDGPGFSLVIVNENAPTSAWNTAAGWRPSAALNGSPGQMEVAPAGFPLVLVNELLSNILPLGGDAVELWNTTTNLVDVGGWFLTDDFDLPKKFTIPSPTTIPPNGYVVFYESNSFGNIGLSSFGFQADGDEVYLFSGNGVNLTGYAHGWTFGASASNVTFGRYVTSTGADHFVAQRTNTLGSSNAGPFVGPIAISEIQYRPFDAAINNVGFNNIDDEFIELRNISSNAVGLFDVAHPTNTWHLRDAVDFDFPTNVTLPVGGYLLIVNFDPADVNALNAFRNRNLVPSAVPIYGPWTGNLDNGTERIDLRRPGTPNPTNINDVPYILVERINYSDEAPWPIDADGFGLSLHRIVPSSYGNDPTNWAAAAPTPGSGYVPGTAPTITSQPGDRIGDNRIVFGTGVSYPATATGTAPLRYQWIFQGANLPGQTNASLSVANFQPGNVGVYNLIVYNSGGYTTGTNFTLVGRVGLAITTQPTNITVAVGQTNGFTVKAVGTGLLRYQWKFNGNNILNGTNATYTISGIQFTNEGTYTVTITDDFNTVTSQSATLSVIAAPVRTLQPFNMTVVEGSSVGLSVAASGTTPISFRWRTNGVNISNVVFVVSPSNSTIIITNISTNFTGLRFTVAITNIAGQSPLTTNAILTVLADTDRDGLPDIWENGRPGFSVNDPSDGERDDDNDGMKNGAEYTAGTDPFNSSSYLKAVLSSTSPATIEFNAVSNRTYTVQYSDVVPGLWQKLGDALARQATRTEVFIDPAGTTNRFYKLVLPAQP
jgi:hypothetical protein